MKKGIFFLTLLTALLFASGVYAQGTPALGTEEGPAQPKGETKSLEGAKGQSEKNLEQTKVPSSEKKPRLKYWDPYEGMSAPSQRLEEQTKGPSSKKKCRLKYFDPYECGC
jgi:hypothetical protein